mgnify:CR=1 FL=1
MYQFHQPDAITLNINKNEIGDHKYVSKQQLIDMMNDPSLLFTPWFKLIVSQFLFKWWDALLEGKLDELKDVDTVHNFITADEKDDDEEEQEEGNGAKNDE